MQHRVDELQTFLARHALSDFRHRARLIAGLASGSCTLVLPPLPDATVAATELLAAMQTRLHSLQGRDDPLGWSLRDDVGELCRGLRRCKTEAVVAWRFSMEPGFDLTVFESADSHTALGCILGVDGRRTDAATWERFFG